MLCNCLVSFFAFSFAASSIYCFNDIYDREADRLHPEKCKRPVASGAISKGMAYAVMIICLVISVLILFFAVETNKFIVTGIIALYYLLNIAYCTVLKRYPIVDVTVISVGFVLRVLVGGFATGVELSEWIILMTFLLALFLAFAKRRDDVLLYQSTGVQLRNNTQRYNLDFMNQVITVIATITIIAYIMYTVSPDVTLRFHCKYVYLTSFFVLIGIIRYLQITIVDLKSGNPTKILLKDRFIQVCIMGWIVSFLIIIYL
jgi:4-hydroxybenzoate polyprenyltransferase